MEQSVNPAARVVITLKTISTSTQNASIWLMTAAAPCDNVFVRRVQIRLLTYLLTYIFFLFICLSILG